MSIKRYEPQRKEYYQPKQKVSVVNNSLSEDQIAEYYKTQSGLPNPVSPLDYQKSLTREPIIVSSERATGKIEKADEKKVALTPEVQDEKVVKEDVKEPEKTGGGYSFDEAIELFGQDFTGLQKLDDGTFEADTSALSRIGIKTDAVKNIQAEQEVETAKKDVEDLTNRLRNLDISNDPSFVALSNGIQNTWNDRIAEMEKANESRTASLTQLGIRYGSKYTGGSFGSIVAEEERQGIQRVSSLEAQKQQALAQAEIAFRSEKWDEYVDLINLAEDKYAQEVEELNTLNEIAVKRNEELAKTNKEQREADKFEMDRVDSVLENITDSVFNAMTGDAEADMQTIQDIAIQYDIDPNYLISGLTNKQGEEEERQADIEAVEALTKQREASAEKSLRVGGDSTKVAELDKVMSPNELRVIRDDYGLSVDELPVGSTMRDVQVLQAKKFAEANKDEDPEEVKKAIEENTDLDDGIIIKILKGVGAGIKKLFGGGDKTEKEDKTDMKEIDDILNSI